MKVARLREWTYISHMALGFSGAAFFVALIAGGFILFPKIEAFLAQSSHAAGNVTTATGVWANSSADQARQVTQVVKDARASVSASGRLADKLTELAATANQQTKQLGPLLASLKTSSDAIAPAVGKIGDTAAAATGLLNNSSKAVAQLYDPEHGISPIMATYMRTGTDLNEILERKAIDRILENAAGISGNFNLISGQFEAVTKKASDDYLGPHPWYTKLGRFASDTYDYGALFARHAP